MKLLTVLALVCGAAIGLYFPDIDRSFPFLLHRSIITHGVLVPLAIVACTAPSGPMWLEAALVGACLALAIHLSFDLFPVVWIGFALISVPLVGRLSVTLSVTWIALNVCVCAYLALRLMRSKFELNAAAALSAAAFVIAARSEHSFWLALFALVGAWFAAACLPNRLVHGQAALHAVRQRWGS